MVWWAFDWKSLYQQIIEKLWFCARPFSLRNRITRGELSNYPIACMHSANVLFLFVKWKIGMRILCIKSSNKSMLQHDVIRFGKIHAKAHVRRALPFSVPVCFACHSWDSVVACTFCIFTSSRYLRIFRLGLSVPCLCVCVPANACGVYRPLCTIPSICHKWIRSACANRHP